VAESSVEYLGVRRTLWLGSCADLCEQSRGLLGKDLSVPGTSRLTELGERGKVRRKDARCCWIRRHDIVGAADHSESTSITTEELLEILESRSTRLERRAGCDDAELVRVWRKSKSVEERTQEVGHLCTRSPAIGVELVDDQIKHPVL
jgi:hypothetical protein